MMVMIVPIQTLANANNVIIKGFAINYSINCIMIMLRRLTRTERARAAFSFNYSLAWNQNIYYELIYINSPRNMHSPRRAVLQFVLSAALVFYFLDTREETRWVVYKQLPSYPTEGG